MERAISLLLSTGTPLLHGRWQEDIEPLDGTTARDREQMKRFGELMREFERTGQFTVPMATGAKPPRSIDLDARLGTAEWVRLSLSELVRQLRLPGRIRRINGQYLGMGRRVLFCRACRAGRQRSYHQPEGNGWIVKKLEEAESIHTAQFTGRRNPQTGPKAPGDDTGSGICV